MKILTFTKATADQIAIFFRSYGDKLIAAINSDIAVYRVENHTFPEGNLCGGSIVLELNNINRLQDDDHGLVLIVTYQQHSFHEADQVAPSQDASRLYLMYEIIRCDGRDVKANDEVVIDLQSDSYGAAIDRFKDDAFSFFISQQGFVTDFFKRQYTDL